MKKGRSAAQGLNNDESGATPLSFILHPSFLHSKRRLGQNFLVDNNIVERIIAAVHPRADETIIEIGPGRGALTSRLVEKAGRVIAVEFDRELAPQLRSQLAGANNFTLIEADALTMNF